MAVTLDPHVRLRPSAKFLSLIDTFWMREDLDEDMPEALAEATPKSLLKTQHVRWIYEKVRDMDVEERLDFGFHDAFAESELVLPEPEFAPRDPELEARCQRLRAEAENREYERMTEDIDRKNTSSQRVDEPIGKQVKELNSYLMLILQFLVSVGASFFAGYLAPYFLYGVEDSGKRLLCGVVLAFVVAVADLYFIMRFFLETEGVINVQEMTKKLN